MSGTTWGYSGGDWRGYVIHLLAHEAAYLEGKNTNSGVARDIYFEPPPCRTLADMSEAEKTKLCEQYGCGIAGEP